MLPIQELIEARLATLNLTTAELIRQCGYKNEAKGIRRLKALFGGDFESTCFLVAAMPRVLSLREDDTQRAIDDSKAQMAAEATARYRAAFRPHAVILTEREVPEQLTIAILAGAFRKKRIDFCPTQGPESYVEETLKRLPATVPGFGRAIGFVIHYTADKAVTYDTVGNLTTTAPASGELGRKQLFFGNREVDPDRVRRFLWADLPRCGKVVPRKWDVTVFNGKRSRAAPALAVKRWSDAASS